MKKILSIFAVLAFSVLLFGCLNAPEAPQTTPNTTIQQTTPNPTPLPPVNAPPVTTKPIITEMTGGEPTGDSVFNIYLKDAPGFVSNVQLTITKVSVLDTSGKATILYSGEKNVDLNNKVTTVIGSGKVFKNRYKTILVEIADTATVTDADGVHQAKVLRKKFSATIDYLMLPGKTVDAILDVTLYQAVKVDPNGNYGFKPAEFAYLDLQEKDGLTIAPLGILTTTQEKQLKITHNAVSDVQQVPVLN